MEDRLCGNDTPEALALDVLELSRSILLVDLRFFDLALSRLTFVPGGGSFATDASRILFSPAHVLLSYREERESVVRAIAHMVLHCVFRHMYGAAPERPDLWDLACDIAVENVIADLGCDSVVTLRQRRQSLRLETLKEGSGVLTAEKLYRRFCGQELAGEDLEELRELFLCDDHGLWYGAVPAAPGAEDRSAVKAGDGVPPEEEPAPETGEAGDDGIFAMPGEGGAGRGSRAGSAGDPGAPESMAGFSAASVKEAEAFWSEVSLRMQRELELFLSEKGNAPGVLTQSLKELNRERHDYASFLRKFAVLGESLGVSDADLDPIYYTYGLRVYGDLPLVEPLEWQERRRIREFVIAIDTSGSVAGETVQRFVEKTCDVLMDSQSFTRRFNVHIIQCDASVREDRVVTSHAEITDCLQSMVLRGFGGTDFRPVFDYVDGLVKAGEFRDLCGLLYFTDGRGIFPRKKPAYKTAFVFLDDDGGAPDVPPWAIRLVLRKEDVSPETRRAESRRAAE